MSNYYVVDPREQELFDSLVSKMASKLELDKDTISLELTLDPQYQNNSSISVEEIVNRQFALGIDESLPYSQQAEQVMSAYGLTDTEFALLTNIDDFWVSKVNF
jgi:hypothetical protein